MEKTNKSQHKNSFRTGNLDRKTRKVIKLWPSQKVSSENNQDEVKESKGDSVVDLDDVSVEESNQLNNYVPDSSSINESKKTERKNSQNLTDNCLITQRINQYLTNVISDEDLQKFQENHLQNFQENHQVSQKREKSDSSIRVSPNLLQHNSTSRQQDRRHISRQKSRQQCPRNRNRYSRKNYWEDFEDFRKGLDDDVNTLGKTQREHYFHETFEACDKCDEDKGQTSDQVILRILPRTREYGRQDDNSTEIGYREYLNHSTKRNKFRKRSQLRKVSKSKNPEASTIWSYL